MKKKYILDRSGVLKGVLVVALCAAPFAFVPASQAGSWNTLTNQDKTFLKEAAQGNMEEVQLGKLAQQKASNTDVRMFGDRMVADHTRLEDQLKTLAAKKDFSLPTNVTAEARNTKLKLSGERSNQFDKNYISDMVKDHEQAIAAFQKEAKMGTDANVKDYATKSLPTLQEHLRLAKNAAQDLGISVS